MSDRDLCAAYHSDSRRQRIYTTAEIQRRQLMTQEDFALAKCYAIQPGISDCAVLASWGRPEIISWAMGSAETRRYRVGYGGVKDLRLEHRELALIRE